MGSEHGNLLIMGKRFLILLALLLSALPPAFAGPRKIAKELEGIDPSKPVNVIAVRPDPNMTVANLADLGVRRISVGSGLARVAWGAFIRAAQEIATLGTFDSLAGLASGAELNQLFRTRT